MPHYNQRSKKNGRSRRYSRYSKYSKPKFAGIHPSKFIRSAVPREETIYNATNKFIDFPLIDLIQQNIAKKGYISPSAIQDQAIPHILEQKDVIGIANTGTGKTAAFSLPTLHRLMQNPSDKVLILAPTRELADQIEKEIASYARGSRLVGALLIGGESMTRQLQELRHNPQIIIGTPGRVMDHARRGSLKLNEINIIVLDEVDRMVDMGFIDDIRFILGEINQERQSLFFSATVSNSINNLIQNFLNNPVTVSVKVSETGENIEQNVVTYSDKSDKFLKLCEMLADVNLRKIIVFDETQRDVERLFQDLQRSGFSVEAIHGGKNQSQRSKALGNFKQNRTNILVATNVAARGIDVADITHVINYSAPTNYEDYIHRIGRAGRAGKIGYALTFVPA